MYLVYVLPICCNVLMLKILVQVSFNFCFILDACLKILNYTHWNDFFFFCILFFERRTDISVDKHMDLFNTFRVMHINDSEPNFVAFG